MKVLHLATYDNFGGAAKAAYRQHRALLAAGIDSSMLVRHRYTSDPTVAVFVGKNRLTDRIARTLRRRWIAHREYYSRCHGGRIISGLTDPRADLLRVMTKDIADADVINFHKTEHFVDLPALLTTIPANKPVVITLHDLSPITGGCDYPVECRLFEGQCGTCPILNSHTTRDYSRQIFNYRQTAYSTRADGRLAFVANSRWTGEMARRSGLAHRQLVEVISLCMDHTVYTSNRRREAREALGIGLDESVVAFAAHDLSLRHKGGHLLHEALMGMSTTGTVRLLTMGAGNIKTGKQFLHTHFGRVESDELQALIYRSADVFVIPSLEEAFGQTALEAAACGTVVAGFEVGGIVDIVKNGINGRLVERGNTGALSRAIYELLQDRELRHRWGKAALAWAQNNFSYGKNATAHIMLYKRLLQVKTDSF